MATDPVKIIYRNEYTPPAYLIEKTLLCFKLFDNFTEVESTLSIKRNNTLSENDCSSSNDLILNGGGQPLENITLNDKLLDPSGYQLDAETLTVKNVPESFTLKLSTVLEPHKNTSLEGLYQSSGNYCTQCEAEGFRKITWFLDRPDVLSKFTTRIEADKDEFPVMLSNGNCVEQGPLPDSQQSNRHFAVWHDPYFKPTYLFALVAGDLAVVEDNFTTASGKNVKLSIYVQHHNKDKCDHALQSLIQSMRWDEQRFGLEYDLDRYMIVAVDDFNMGAMENKGLNVFNSKYVLCKPDTATDNDYANVQGVIGHEYFHNWTGNRVTCRDWFQLSLKEGLTVFRDQEFSADMNSKAIKRIHDARILKTLQFPEDAGPMAHPVRPDSYIQIDNFYTLTVYNKGAEVIRMIHTLLGEKRFRAGMDLYFERHDGQAVTIEDFVVAMADASGVDLGQFKKWYSQAGTPHVKVMEEYDKSTEKYKLVLVQSCPPTPEQVEKENFHIPLKYELLDDTGKVENSSRYTTIVSGNNNVAEGIIHLRDEVCELEFSDIPSKPILSLGREFSAPVKFEHQQSLETLAFLMQHDNDEYNRYDAAHRFAVIVLLQIIKQVQTQALATDDELSAMNDVNELVNAYEKMFTDESIDRALLAEALILPSERYLADQFDCVDVDAIYLARKLLRKQLANRLAPQFDTAMRQSQTNQEYAFNAEAVAKRTLKNISLAYLMEVKDKSLAQDYKNEAIQQLKSTDNMTDQLAAFVNLCNSSEPQFAIDYFHDRWKHDSLVMDKWFATQAMADQNDTLDRVKALTQHPAYLNNNPNKIYSLIGVFCNGNRVYFHATDGEGYKFAADQILAIDGVNSSVAARLMSSFSQLKRYDDKRKDLMTQQIKRILLHENLSKNTYEIASKALSY